MKNNQPNSNTEASITPVSQHNVLGDIKAQIEALTVYSCHGWDSRRGDMKPNCDGEGEWLKRESILDLLDAAASSSDAMGDVYLVSAMVERPGATGHRAQVARFGSKEEAVGSSLELWQTDGWSVVSYECTRCDKLMSSFKPQLRLEQAVKLRE